MKPLLARTILTKLIGWDDPEEIQRNLDSLGSMANIKYDEYQQFNPGVRFFESLIQWIRQFDEKDRNTLFKFVMTNLIFISNDEMLHLVEIAFPDLLNKKILKKVSTKINVKPYHVSHILQSSEYKEYVRKSLFIGLSDGSRIANFRRANPILNNEQVYPTYEISDEKCKEFLKDLNKDYKDSKFETIFLIDDFTASGISYFREEDGVKKGKIFKFLNFIHINKGYQELISMDNFSVHILFYISTQNALDRIKSHIEIWKKENGYSFESSVEAILVLSTQINEKIENAGEATLLKKYYDNRIEDSNFIKGGGTEGWFGFNKCGLPIVLNHNTPNNSLPILWTPKDGIDQFRGLFPRISRHKDEYEAT